LRCSVAYVPSFAIVSIYVPVVGTVTENAPVADVVTGGKGEAGTPQGMLDAVCAALHVVAVGRLPTVTVNPTSAVPAVKSTAVPEIVSGTGVGVGVTTGTTPPPPPPDVLPPPPPPQAATVTAAAASAKPNTKFCTRTL
jgi:hypothetical protein